MCDNSELKANFLVENILYISINHKCSSVVPQKTLILSGFVR